MIVEKMARKKMACQNDKGVLLAKKSRSLLTLPGLHVRETNWETCVVRSLASKARSLLDHNLPNPEAVQVLPIVLRLGLSVGLHFCLVAWFCLDIGSELQRKRACQATRTTSGSASSPKRSSAGSDLLEARTRSFSCVLPVYVESIKTYDF